MTFVDVVTATAILVVFFSGLSQSYLPAFRAWEKAEAEHRKGQTIYFVAESFRGECAKRDRNIENWKRIIAAAKELESVEIIEMREGEELRAIKAKCVIGGEYVEIIGLCTP